ncbi:sigma-70 family RNA polymerase sigma factor [Arcicella sp. DC2W]|uniref:Sigma-70 family RNA polymerase sigma factor n=1 Tax=Arcicella gelida TaxID=2984195 RepID=A0ABU5S7G4_9BACT|nr:sigma-70 family RNA polymerase sigma factor [Arcicella sp. DC2W]MEA5404391.1 sigma-70 family RNA polymerase sigma factor [Arcicella sp. DC2W]
MNQRYSPSDVVDILRSNNHTEINNVTVFLYRFFKPIIASHIFKQGGNYDDAKDIFQEVIIIFFRQVRHLKFEAKSLKEMEGYFIQIANNKWLKKKEADGRRFRREQEYLTQKNVYTQELTSSAILENEEENSSLPNILERLGEPCRSILMAYYGEELSIKDIALRFNLGNPDAVKVRKFRCLEKLKTLLLKP